MSRRIYLLVALLCLPLLAPSFATAQQEEPVFTRVGLWRVPRAQWDAWVEAFNQNTRPVLERLLAEGKITAWGNTDAVIHGEEGWTHKNWVQAPSIAGVESFVDALRAVARALPPAERQRRQAEFAARIEKHRDYLLRSLIHRGRAASTTSGYLRVRYVQMKPGKGREWYGLWEKYFKPTYDELLANGTILMYEVQHEQVHTQNPRGRWIVYVAPSLEAVDKVRAAFAAVFQKEAPAMFAALNEVSVRSAHRGFFDRLLNYAHK